MFCVPFNFPNLLCCSHVTGLMLNVICVQRSLKLRSPDQDETDESRRSSVASVSQASDVKGDKEKPGSRRTSMVPEKQTKEVTFHHCPCKTHVLISESFASKKTIRYVRSLVNAMIFEYIRQSTQKKEETNLCNCNRMSQYMPKKWLS